ncbi:hypothetical protein EKO23_16435 [Nocardioides guangzhouensis]|uniref:Glycosyltransferase RgtA/B/C/D-like domain-containing protein n=1 Tax=Nocardioides guangzhouensis TaxID=2497878 RepID=A0A4Q4ZAK5_9ACTN|nr:hypothetical protein [Nocardioides guangzhouensis]RYP84246.1 hypothetical protein EKO23_16435 [Nocardioides guangzhouensis]
MTATGSTTATADPSEPGAGRPPRRRRIDPLGPVLALAAGVVYVLHGFGHYLSRDLGLYAYAGQQVADGVLPYEGVINRSGPLSHLVPGVGAFLGRLVGVDDLLAMRAFFLVLSMACIWLAYLLGRDLLGSRLTGVTVAVALLFVDGFTQYASGGPREKTTLMLFLLASLIALARRRFGWSGIFVSLATLTWQPVFFVGLVTGLVGLIAVERGRRLGAMVRFLVGGLVPLAIFLVWYAVAGHLRDFLDCFVLIHVQYTQQEGFQSEPDVIWEEVRKAYGPSLWMLIGGGITLLVACVRILLSTERRADPDRRLVLACGAGLLAGFLWSLRAFNGWPDAFFVLPMCLIGVGEVARAVAARVPARVAVALVAAWTVAATASAVDFSWTGRSDVLDEQQASVDAVIGVLGDDVEITSVEAPQALVLTGKTNPTQHQMFTLGLEDYVDDTWPGGLEGFAAGIREDAPTLVALGTLNPTWLRPVLDEDYWKVSTTPGWTWYVNKSVGRDTYQQLLDATRSSS